MNFRTELPSTPSTHTITHAHKILTVGSCFAETIGGYLQQGKFDTLTNPFGIIYNPVALFESLSWNKVLDERNLLTRDGRWYYLGAHSSLSGHSEGELLSELGNRSKLTHQFLSACHTLIVTFGSAYAYRWLESNQLVANCHKLPQQQFAKQLLSLNEMHESFQRFYRQAVERNPALRIICTVSPVRHLKDTISLNTVSKSLLRVFSHELTQLYERIEYFPSYELLMDDLRDYRFYTEDLIHPTDVAQKYIWKKFSETYFSSHTLNLLTQVEDIRRCLAHRPFQPGTVEYKRFLEITLKKVQALEGTLNMSEELNLLNQRLAQAGEGVV